MSNISACVAGFKESPPTFVRFFPQDIAPYLLPKSINLSRRHRKNPWMMWCDFPTDFLIDTNDFTSRLAVCSFRRMVGMETSVVKAAYEAMSRVIPDIPVPEPNQSSHPAISFVKEAAPKIIEDCFNNGLWSAVGPLVSHHITSIRQIVLHKVVLLAQFSDRNQRGLVEVRILAFLDQYYQLPSPPSDIIDLFVRILPLVAEKLCRKRSGIEWLLTRLSDSSPKINRAVIEAFRMGVAKQDLTVLQMFVNVKLLKKLDKPPTQPLLSSSVSYSQCWPSHMHVQMLLKESSLS